MSADEVKGYWLKISFAGKAEAPKFCNTVEELIANEKVINLYPEKDRKKLIQLLKKSGEVEGYEICLKVKDKETY